MARTPARLFGHPIHPMLIPLPIGLWSFSLFADVLARRKNSAAWEHTAFATLAAGTVTGYAASVPGAIDFASLQNPRVKRIALAHMLINIATLGLYSLNAALRIAGRRGRLPLALSAAGVAAIGVSGWLGGELAYRHRVGVDTESEKDVDRAARDRHITERFN